ncbi:MAG: DUF2974 domain-containing protein [Firmicutes bacterium]|nr:DUF2974 domain-containing protein [Bacillota bacterium]
MINFVDYVKYTSEPLSLQNFTDVDALVLSQLAYMKFDNIKDGLMLSEMKGKFVDLIKGTRVAEKNYELLTYLVKNPRFASIRVTRYVNDFNWLAVKQLSAVTFIIDKRFIYVAFRGTDGTIVGWEEDLNMAFMDEVPAQAQAAEYLTAVAKKYWLSQIIVGGHSKGGNLAVFASMKQNPKTLKRIVKIYNFDGPEFKQDVCDLPEYQAIQPKVIKIVPESSIIGMLLQRTDHFQVVKAEGALFFQHDLYNWTIDENTGDFVRLKELSKASKNIKSSLYDWLNKFNNDERQIIIDNLFDILNATECTTFSEFVKNWKNNVTKLIAQYENTDDNTKELLKKSLATLAKYLAISYLPKKHKEKEEK